MYAATVINQVFELFIIIVIGFIAAKCKILNRDSSKKLSEILLNITLPAMIIVSFQFKFSKDTLVKGLIFLGVCFLVSFLFIVLSTLIFRKFNGPKKSVLIFASVFCNSSFMGFPVLKGLFGAEGIYYGSMFVVCFNFLVWTYGLVLYTGEKNLNSVKKAVLNPGFISVIIGLLFFIFSVNLPKPIFEPLDMVGSMTVPISMLVIGALIAETRLVNLFSQASIYFGALIRLVIFPLLVLIVLHFTGFPTHLRDIMVVIVAMPAAVNTAIFAEMFDGDSLYASQTVAIQTILSIATVPLIIIFTKFF